MPARLTIAQAFTELAEALDLAWVIGSADRSRTVDQRAYPSIRVIGPLNYNSPNRVQLLGQAEIKVFADRDAFDATHFDYSLADTVEAFVVTDRLAPPTALLDWSIAYDVPILTSTRPFGDLQQHLRHLITRRLAERRIIHGVMMDVHGTGVLITGDASVGKSEVALELVTRGHILVADDAPEFTRLAPDTLESSCPPLLQDFLEVRGLGVLNIARMYGESHTRRRKILRFIVRLQTVSSATGTPLDSTYDQVAGERLREPDRLRHILGVPIPERVLPVAPGRNLAVLVEAAVRDYNLRARGYSATRDLVDKQARALRGESA